MMQNAFKKTVLALAVASTSQALASSKLADRPLFLGMEVQPNVLWLVDDSGSMDWEKLLSKEALDAFAASSSSNFHKYYLDFETPNSDEEKRELCAGYNVMAYDPTKRYTPWTGSDRAGNRFTDANISAARKNPYQLASDSYKDNYENKDAGYDSSNNTQDLTGHQYYRWNDIDKDGVYDQGECSTSDSNRVRVSTLSSAEQTNYANWYSYYRKREYVAKSALSTIISESQTRMGLATLHNNNSVGTLIKDIDDISVPLDGSAQSNKRNLLKNLFDIDSKSGTPLRQTLEKAGKYFEVGVNPGNGLFGFSPSPSSPILPADKGGECQQNFSILMSDGYWNGNAPSVGNTDADGAGSFDGDSYADSQSNTLADVAMHYYERDLASSLDNKVPVIAGLDENRAQHMVTYTVAFGVNGQLDANPDNRKDAFTWPTPVKDTATTIDDLRHAAWNGRGEFLNASDPQSLIDSLTDAINDIADRQGSASAVAFNSTSVNTGTKVFQARFDSGNWSGSLDAFNYDEDGLGAKAWNAAEKINDRDLSKKPRQIVSYNGNRGVAFRFPSDYINWQSDELSPTQVLDLLKSAPYSLFSSDPSERNAVQTYGEQIIDFLRGNGALEEANGGNFRNRYGKRLGDIVHSSPEYVGKPNRQYPNKIAGNANLYSDFVAANAKRKPMVYVGANDGMLHGFDAETGEEHFAYVPGLVYSSDAGRGLNALASPNYKHIPYVDGELNVGDVFVNGKWRSYLVGSLRAGGQGIYVLDVTDPAKLTESNAQQVVLREFAEANLGHVFGQPQIVKMNNGRWAALVGNGYQPKSSAYLDGKARLYVVYLDSSWDYHMIETGLGSVSNQDCQDPASTCNGLATPTSVDLDGNGTVDRIYAGDMEGNLWSFDVSSSSAVNWKSSYQQSGKPQALFTACSDSTCTSTNRQPITSAPVVKSHPYRINQSTEPNLLIYVGTGSYKTEADSLSTAKQSMYGIWDAGIGGLTRDSLQLQLVSDSTTVPGGRDLTKNDVTYSHAGSEVEMGWYIDLPDSGERIVAQPSVVGDIVFFNSMVPDSSSCGNGGYGFLMFADRLTGSQPDFTVLDLNDDGVFVDEIVGGIEISAIPSGGRFIDGHQVISDSSGAIEDFMIQTQAAKPSKRSSWAIDQ